MKLDIVHTVRKHDDIVRSVADLLHIVEGHIHDLMVRSLVFLHCLAILSVKFRIGLLDGVLLELQGLRRCPFAAGHSHRADKKDV